MMKRQATGPNVKNEGNCLTQARSTRSSKRLTNRAKNENSEIEIEQLRLSQENQPAMRRRMRHDTVSRELETAYYLDKDLSLE